MKFPQLRKIEHTFGEHVFGEWGVVVKCVDFNPVEPHRLHPPQSPKNIIGSAAIEMPSMYILYFFG